MTKASAAPVCNHCRASFSRLENNLCRCCSDPLDVDGVWFAGQFPSEGLLCRPCRLVPPEFERAVAFASYQGQLREMVHLLKYERMRSLAPILGTNLAQTMLTLKQDLPQGCVVLSVPLFPSRQRQRGYNQAELLASVAVASLRRSDPQWHLREQHGALARVKDTQSQYSLTPQGRRRNLVGAFAVSNPAAIAGKDILLVDDIYTSGATARACARVLKRAAARRIFVVTLTRAHNERIATWDAPAVIQPAHNLKPSSTIFNA